MKKLLIVSVFAAVAIQALAESLSVDSGTRTLESSGTYDSLSMAGGTTLDLNGHDVMISAGYATPASLVTITNSSGTPATIVLNAPAEGWYDQFQKTKFTGNLAVVIAGNVKNENDWNQHQYGGVVNTHTGGTTLDGYGANLTRNYPRFTTKSFGTGVLTLKNAAKIMCAEGSGSDRLTATFAGISVETGANPVIFKNDRYLTIPGDLTFKGGQLRIESDANNPRGTTFTGKAAFAANGTSLVIWDGQGVTFGAGATIDASHSATVRNNNGSKMATVEFGPVADGWGRQFERISFSGLVKLVVKGPVNANAALAREGFQGVNNTHTGGTVLDGYGYTYVGGTAEATDNNDGYWPRFSNNTAFGTGGLTLKNGARLCYVGGEESTVTTAIAVANDEGNDAPNTFKSDRRMTLSGTLTATANSTLRLYGYGKDTLFSGDATGFAGTLLFRGGPAGHAANFAFASSLPQATLCYRKDAVGTVSYVGTDSVFELGNLTTETTQTGNNRNAFLTFVGDHERMTLKVGGKNEDGRFWSDLDGKWDIVKCGSGEMKFQVGLQHNANATVTVERKAGNLLFADDRMTAVTTLGKYTHKKTAYQLTTYYYAMPFVVVVY